MTNYAYNESTKEKRKPQMSYIKLQRLLHVIVEKYLPCTHEKIGRQRLHPLMFTHVPTFINGLSFHSIHCNGVPQLFPFSPPGWSQLASSRADTTNVLSPNPYQWLSSSPHWPAVRQESVPILWDIHFKHPGLSPAITLPFIQLAKQS